ncbi:hypothetical protein AVEN_135716-1 [Araneus ventricosus]|uniref:Uncharacterized protein n=1 Tax=Araneus ventricosus TaxID=182803 RepID=A0A4Y2RAJ2_ARAVE|nr:hypothetical protein AVEN_135716-1 [Araneus ventricosus]
MGRAASSIGQSNIGAPHKKASWKIIKGNSVSLEGKHPMLTNNSFLKYPSVYLFLNIALLEYSQMSKSMTVFQRFVFLSHAMPCPALKRLGYWWAHNKVMLD